MKSIDLIYCPYDSGQRDVRMGAGPLRIRAHGAEARLRGAGASVRETLIEADSPFRAEVKTAFELHRRIGAAVAASRAGGYFPCVIAGNCNSGAIGAASGVGAAGTGVLWFDAHDDCETPESTPSGFLDGMGLAILTGQCWQNMLRSQSGVEPLRGERTVLIGARDVSSAADQHIRQAGIERIGVGDIRRNGVEAVFKPAMQRLKATGARQLVVHVDLDVHDPDEISPANCYAVPGGLRAQEVRDAIRAASEEIEIAAASIASFDPAFDVDDRMLGTTLDLLEFITCQCALRPRVAAL